MTQNSTFDAILKRRSVRSFSQREVSDDSLVELLHLANRAPSGFNLQPWHFLIVRDESLKHLMCHSAMNQKQVIDAPVVVVFIADPLAWKKTYPEVLRQSVASGALSKERAKRYQKSVSILFRLGIFNCFGIAKKVGTAVRKLKLPTPRVITSADEAEHYVRAQTMLAVSTFMIGAQSIGLGTCPMEGFDEERLKKLLLIPERMTIPVIMPVGYPLDTEEPTWSIRIPVIEKISRDLFPSKAFKK